MNLENLKAIDHARAAQLAVAVLDDDDAMASDAINSMTEDPRPDVVVTTLLASAGQLVDLAREVLGEQSARELLRATLTQLRGAVDEEAQR